MDTEQYKRIGIMGGTFNPIHTGHLLLAEYAKEACLLDKVLFIPTGNSYMKNAKEIVSGAHRLRMVELALEGVAGFEGSDIEICREGNTYTYETLSVLKESYPDAELYFLMGADSFLSIQNWRFPEKILANAVLAVVTREHATQEALKEQCQKLLAAYGGRIELLSFPDIELSSTEIRRRVKEGRSIRFQTPEKVRQYILKMGLYQEKGIEVHGI